MTDDPRQMQLFESFAPSATAGSPSSPRSSALSTSSSEASTNSPDDATATGQIHRATARSFRDGAACAGTSPSGGATSTGASDQQLTLSISTRPNTEAKLLAVPRPRRLDECSEEARPCPWVSCRHHLLLEVASPKVQYRKDPRATTLRLNMPRRDRIRFGRRPGLASSAASAIVQTWIDDAVELLARMPYTCTFDVVRDYPDGLTARGLAVLLGVTEQAVDKELRLAGRRYRDRHRAAKESEPLTY